MAEDDENVVALGEIDRINENINKTRVDGLQVLHAVSFVSGFEGFKKVIFTLNFILYSSALKPRARTMW